MQPGVLKFIDDMTQVGFTPRVEADLVILEIVPCRRRPSGAYGRNRCRH